ncbi:MAG: AAA family ATPase [Deltaproteobacteria bacterium]|nr:AAA family ATPase [Deltaproteobacteria bacterium]
MTLARDRFLHTLKHLLSDLDPLSPLRPGMEALLTYTAREMGYPRMALTIFDPKTNLLRCSASHGHSQTSAVSYTPGQGIVGLVQSTGQGIIVPIMAEDPRFLNLAGRRSAPELHELSYAAVPVFPAGTAQEAEVIGVLSADIPASADRSLDTLARHRLFLEILAAVIARQTAYMQERLQMQSDLAPDLGLDCAGQDLARNSIVGTSKAMAGIMAQIRQVAGTRATVLLRGESGTGKELLAQAIHNMSPRSGGPFVRLNCATLPAHLVESELFGHVRGAFTGAVDSKRGRFELADKGTLFLDEIGELSSDTQAKLLRALQEGEIQRLGSEKTTHVDVRIICATHQNLEEMIEARLFREDLYYRINVFPVFIPPLRDRREDILVLAEHFLQSFSREYGKDIKRISTPAIDLLVQYHWPGNVRELRNCLERAVLLCMETAIRTYHLPPTLQTAESSASEVDLSFGEAVSKFEQEVIVDALKKARGNMLQAARDLRASYRIINYKVKKYRIDSKKYR